MSTIRVTYKAVAFDGERWTLRGQLGKELVELGIPEPKVSRVSFHAELVFFTEVEAVIFKLRWPELVYPPRR